MNHATRYGPRIVGYIYFIFKVLPDLWRNSVSSQLWCRCFLNVLYLTEEFLVLYEELVSVMPDGSKLGISWNFKTRDCCFLYCFIPLCDRCWKYLCCFQKQTVGSVVDTVVKTAQCMRTNAMSHHRRMETWKRRKGNENEDFGSLPMFIGWIVQGFYKDLLDC